jgi:hypothetical protein
MWLVLIVALSSQAAMGLKILGANPLGMAFILTYGALFVIQFACMIVHRFNTFVQYIATLSLAGNMMSHSIDAGRRAARLHQLNAIR